MLLYCSSCGANFGTLTKATLSLSILAAQQPAKVAASPKEVSVIVQLEK